MAHEQWTVGAITPATDQFAFCVSLWEALDGERPYVGSSPEELRSQVARGPVALDTSRIPRRLRQLLRCGLDPDPTKRWPTMNHVLTQLGRARHMPVVVAAVAATVGMAAIVFVVAQRPHGDRRRCQSLAHGFLQISGSTRGFAGSLVDHAHDRRTSRPRRVRGRRLAAPGCPVCLISTQK
jgi:hypothetical protein